MKATIELLKKMLKACDAGNGTVTVEAARKIIDAS